jgi:F-box protein 18 (helicase)
MSQRTQEQLAVVHSHAKLLSVNAFAGTGKTTVLVDYAAARPGRRILYLAFNRAVANEAKERFPENVDCRTTHSLAYGPVGRRFSAKLGNAQPFEVAKLCRCNPRRAKLVLQTVSAWLCSIDPEIAPHHVPKDGDINEDAEAEAWEARAPVVADQARKVWEEMQRADSQILMPHDGYLKLWAMEHPNLRYDVILLDEAQDTNPLTLDLVLAQRHATIVLVGDRHQGIYGFRKAMNAMEAVKPQARLSLTQSFRFGQGIADIASLLLRTFKDEPNPVRGRHDITVRWYVNTSKPYTHIARTNAGLFEAAAQVLRGAGDRRLHFVGGFQSYLFGKVLDAYHLWVDERARIKEAAIARFPNFAEFAQYGEEAGDAEVRALVKVVEQYRGEIPSLYDAIKAADTPVQGQAHVTLTTAHKAKGLEWSQVRLADDFVELPPKDDDFDPEEINLLYVAVTRAIEAIHLPSNLDGWLSSVGFREHQSDRPTGTAASDRRDAKDGGPINDPNRMDPQDREQWIRSNLTSYGDAAADLVFLLERLDQARAAANALGDSQVAKAWHMADADH